jgi:hypothetical protein
VLATSSYTATLVSTHQAAPCGAQEFPVQHILRNLLQTRTRHWHWPSQRKTPPAIWQNPNIELSTLIELQ